jgi:hypothetical protein
MLDSVFISTAGYVALGFVPAICALELVWRKAYRAGKRDAASTVGKVIKSNKNNNDAVTTAAATRTVSK